jgi:hypothetical protein
MEQLQLKLFPWIPSSLEDLIQAKQKPTHPRGIAICVGTEHAEMGYRTVKSIRNVLRSTLPIEIFYLGDSDLPLNERRRFEAIPDVRVHDLTDLFNNKFIRLQGWSCKPFAMLAASFREVILMDADVLMMRDPVSLFDMQTYTQTRTVFFYDRTSIWNDEGKFDMDRQWMMSLIPTPSDQMRNSRWFRDKGFHEQESGVVVMDTYRHLISLLTTCLLNAMPYRQEVYRHVYGDKETFWMGFEMCKEPYDFVPGFGGSVGPLKQMDGKQMPCGLLAHVDEHGRLLWFNGAYDEVQFDTFAVDWIGETSVWQQGPPGTFDCISYPNMDITYLSKEEQDWIARMQSGK